MKTLNTQWVALIVIAFTLLAGCASQPNYKPANGSGLGYSESEISPNRYRVHYKARGDNSDEARDYALLRAAELTLLKDFDWFVVVDRETLVDREQASASTQVGTQRTVTRDCGLLGCSTRVQQTPTRSIGINSGSRGQAEVTLEIRMGKGVRPSGDSYDALEVRESLENKKS